MIIDLIILAVVAFIQNAAFTAVSRSRNSGDPGYHRWCAIGSNGVWFVTNILITMKVWDVLKTGAWWQLVVVGIVYVIATTEGSVWMMRRMLRSETGLRKVGAS